MEGINFPISESCMPEYRPIIKALSVHRKAGTVAETAPAILIRSGRSPAGSSPGHSPSFWLPMQDNTNSFNTALEVLPRLSQ